MGKRPTPKVRREFNVWFATHDWWHDNTALDRLKPVYFQLAQHMEADEIEEILNEVIGVMRNEYGE